jgi:hypothetical protein
VIAALVIATTGGSCAPAGRAWRGARDALAGRPAAADSLVVELADLGGCFSRRRYAFSLVGGEDDFTGGGVSGPHGPGCSFVFGDVRRVRGGAVLPLRVWSGLDTGGQRSTVDTLRARAGRACRRALAAGGTAIVYLWSDRERVPDDC